MQAFGREAGGLAWREIRRQGSESLEPRPVRRSSLGLRGMAPVHPRAPHTRLVGSALREACLTDAGLTVQKEHPSAPIEGTVEPGYKLSELGFAPDEQWFFAHPLQPVCAPTR